MLVKLERFGNKNVEYFNRDLIAKVTIPKTEDRIQLLLKDLTAPDCHVLLTNTEANRMAIGFPMSEQVEKEIQEFIGYKKNKERFDADIEHLRKLHDELIVKCAIAKDKSEGVDRTNVVAGERIKAPVSIVKGEETNEPVGDKVEQMVEPEPKSKATKKTSKKVSDENPEELLG